MTDAVRAMDALSLLILEWVIKSGVHRLLFLLVPALPT